MRLTNIDAHSSLVCQGPASRGTQTHSRNLELAHTDTCTHAHMRTQRQVCTHTHARVYACLLVCSHTGRKPMHARTHVRAHTHKKTQTNTHTNAHQCTHARRSFLRYPVPELKNSMSDHHSFAKMIDYALCLITMVVDLYRRSGSHDSLCLHMIPVHGRSHRCSCLMVRLVSQGRSHSCS